MPRAHQLNKTKGDDGSAKICYLRTFQNFFFLTLYNGLRLCLHGVFVGRVKILLKI